MITVIRLITQPINKAIIKKIKFAGTTSSSAEKSPLITQLLTSLYSDKRVRVANDILIKTSVEQYLLEMKITLIKFIIAITYAIKPKIAQFQAKPAFIHHTSDITAAKTIIPTIILL